MLLIWGGEVRNGTLCDYCPGMLLIGGGKVRNGALEDYCTGMLLNCLLYPSEAADETRGVHLG